MIKDSIVEMGQGCEDEPCQDNSCIIHLLIAFHADTPISITHDDLAGGTDI